MLLALTRDSLPDGASCRCRGTGESGHVGVQVPLWDVHKTGECTHWCSPSAYHVWVFLLNQLLRDEGIGNELQPDRVFAAV